MIRNTNLIENEKLIDHTTKVRSDYAESHNMNNVTTNYNTSVRYTAID